VIAKGSLKAVGAANSVIVPPGVIRPILFARSSVNHRFPSGPVTMPTGELIGVGMANSTA
jgi:hypothetical protein